MNILAIRIENTSILASKTSPILKTPEIRAKMAINRIITAMIRDLEFLFCSINFFTSKLLQVGEYIKCSGPKVHNIL